jgi:hypothetical protein
MQLSEAAQLDPTDLPPKELLLMESSIASIIPPSSVGENYLPSSMNTDYPEPSSAASWARAQAQLQRHQQQQAVPPASASAAGSVAAGGAEYPSSPGRPGSSERGPMSGNYPGPIPPSSRGGLSGHSGAVA